MADFSIASAGLAIDGAISRLVRDLTSPPLPPAAERIRSIAKFRAAREGTIAMIQDLTQLQTDFFPAKGAWSVGQIVQHLILTENLYRTQMQILIELARNGGKQHIELTFAELDNSIAFIPREVIAGLAVPLTVFNLFVPRPVREAMFRNPVIPALSPSASQPTLSQPITELRSRAVSSLNVTEEMFRAELPPSLMNVTLGHPLLGINNVTQILGILAAHEERHHGQMRAVTAKPHFPPANTVRQRAELSGGSIPL